MAYIRNITADIVFLFIFILAGYSSIAFAERGDQEFTILLAGDAIITQPWSNKTDPNFRKLVEKITQADVAVVNLEVVVNDYKGYAQAQSGGIHLAARAVVAKELAWVGFDMVSAANNHAFDYGSIGALETIRNIKDSGMLIAGIGEDLQTARAPVIFTSSKGSVSLVSVTSSFLPYGIASRSRPDIQGRPGPNYCRVVEKAGVYSVKSEDEVDNLKSVIKASESSNYVIFSIHWHHSDIGWLQKISHKAIDSGADIVFCHGPHRIEPIEIYNNRPIFYGLGDFVFQNEQLEKLPVEQYEMYGLDEDADPKDVIEARYQNYTKGFPTQKEVWEGLLAEVTFKGDSLSRINLFPIDLRFGMPVPPRGTPIYADADTGKEIINKTDKISKDYDTTIEYLSEPNCGSISLESNHK